MTLWWPTDLLGGPENTTSSELQLPSASEDALIHLVLLKDLPLSTRQFCHEMEGF